MRRTRTRLETMEASGASWKQLEGIWHPEGNQETPGSQANPGDTHEASRKNPGGTQEALRRQSRGTYRQPAGTLRHPGQELG